MIESTTLKINSKQVKKKNEAYRILFEKTRNPFRDIFDSERRQKLFPQTYEPVDLVFKWPPFLNPTKVYLHIYLSSITFETNTTRLLLSWVRFVLKTSAMNKRDTLYIRVSCDLEYLNFEIGTVP